MAKDKPFTGEDGDCPITNPASFWQRYLEKILKGGAIHLRGGGLDTQISARWSGGEINIDTTDLKTILVIPPSTPVQFDGSSRTIIFTHEGISYKISAN